MFDLFNCTEAYSCKAPLPLSQLTPEPRLRPVELYPSCREVKDPPVNPLRSVPRDLLHDISLNLLFHFSLLIFRGVFVRQYIVQFSYFNCFCLLIIIFVFVIVMAQCYSLTIG